MLLLALSAPSFAEEPDHEVHQELRALFGHAQQAVNEGHLGELDALVTDDFQATSVTQEVVRGREGLHTYFDTWFGPDAYMKAMRFELVADELTDLSEDKSWGLVSGGGLERYEANEGYTFDFRSRWTSVVERGADGRWRIRAIHFGTSTLDNPVLTRVKSTMATYGAVAAGATGLLSGALGFLLGRRSARTRASAAVQS
jgi:ketosteroid isomerase-like protein